MVKKGAGLKALRWVLWILLAWIFVRGTASFLLPAEAASGPAKAAESNPLRPEGLEAFTAMFAQEYLTWSPGEVESHGKRVQEFVSAELAKRAEWLPTSQEAGQQIAASWVYSVRSISPTRWLVTIAARVTPYRPATAESAVLPLESRTVYLAVPVGRTAAGGWSVYDYPTLLPPPAGGTFEEPLHYGQEVEDEGGQTKALLTRFFQAYLSNNATDLPYYLTPESTIRAFQSPWRFDTVTQVLLSQTDSGRYALAEVVLVDPVSGARYVNRYTVGLSQREGRWYIDQLLQKGE